MNAGMCVISSVEPEVPGKHPRASWKFVSKLTSDALVLPHNASPGRRAAPSTPVRCPRKQIVSHSFVSVPNISGWPYFAIGRRPLKAEKAKEELRGILEHLSPRSDFLFAEIKANTTEGAPSEAGPENMF